MSDETPIHITRDEALSRHVDDLLQRQRSLHGLPQARRDTRPPWYLRNWLVLGIAGFVGAFAAWAIVEPYFNDMHYLQGPLERVDLNATTPAVGEDSLELQGTLRIGGDTLWVPVGARVLGSNDFLDLASLSAGQEVGVYVERAWTGRQGVGVVEFLVPSPPVADRTTRSLETLVHRSQVAGMLIFPLVAGLVGLAVGAADGLVCRLPRRALLAGGVGLVVGLFGGLFSSIAANIVYAPLTAFATRHMNGGSMTALAFGVQVLGRTLAWTLAGMAMGLGQGVALRSRRLLLFGFVGGAVGGLLGGALFDPIDLVLLGGDKPSAHWSRLLGFTIIGVSAGVMIGLVELLARDAWLRMTEGPLAGKEFLIFKDLLRIGASPRADIYLFNDKLVADHHATLRAVGEECELENHSAQQPLLVNGRPIQRTRLNHGDQITIGRTSFVFQRRQA